MVHCRGRCGERCACFRMMAGAERADADARACVRTEEAQRLRCAPHTRKPGHTGAERTMRARLCCGASCAHCGARTSVSRQRGKKIYRIRFSECLRLRLGTENSDSWPCSRRPSSRASLSSHEVEDETRIPECAMWGTWSTCGALGALASADCRAASAFPRVASLRS